MRILNILRTLQDDLEYKEGLLNSYDGEDKEVRDILRSDIAEIKAKMEPFLVINDNREEAQVCEDRPGENGEYDSTDTSDDEAICSRESA